MRGGGEGRWEGKTTVAHSLSPLPLEKRIPDRKMGSFLKQQLAIKSMAPVMKKVMNSHMSFLLYRDEAKISCNMEMY